MNQLRMAWLMGVVLAFAAFRCSDDPEGAEGGTDTETVKPADTSGREDGDTSGTDEEGNDSSDEIGRGDGSTETGPDVTTDTFDECAGITETAEIKKAPADVVIAVDNSATMREEAQLVQSKLNDFSERITSAGVDAHVVLISAGNPPDDQGICVEPPLGSGSCPDDSNPDKDYLHVDERLESRESLRRVMDYYEEWKEPLRSGAVLHFLFVSDDNAYDDDGEEFLEWLGELDKKPAEIKISAIVSSEGKKEAEAKDPPGECAEMAPINGAGDEYKYLVSETGGVLGDLCLQQQGEFEKVFDEVAAQISAIGLACSWQIPEPPNGQSLDPGKVNVKLTDGGGDGRTVGYVNSEKECENVEDGWYYDNPSSPQTIILCDQTCDGIQGRSDAQVELVFGCETKNAEPV